MRVYYCRSRSVSSYFIRFVTWSAWSHVAIALPSYPDIIVESTFLANGVRETLLSKFMKKHRVVRWVDYTIPDETAAEHFLSDQLGKPYDVGGALGFLFRRQWDSDRRWFCNELFEAAAVAGGVSRWRSNSLNRISPGASYANLLGSAPLGVAK